MRIDGSRVGIGCVLVVVPVTAGLTAGATTRSGVTRPARHRSPEAGAWGGEQWRRQLLRDEHGEIAPGELAAALLQRQRLVRSRFPGSVIAETAGLGGWSFKGPNNVGGRTRSLLVDPRNPAHLWAGSVSGGIFVSN